MPDQRTAEKRLISVALASLCFLALAACAKSPQPQDSDLSRAVDQALAVYSKDGLPGLIAISQDCYTHDKVRLRCVNQDIVASQIDNVLADSTGVHRNTYYTEDQFFSRATPEFVNSGMNMQQSNHYLSLATEQIRKLLLIKTYRSK